MTNYYRVLSLNVATWLKMHGFSIERTEKENGNTVFYFTRTDELHKCIDEYNNDSKLKKFIATYKDIRNITKALK